MEKARHLSEESQHNAQVDQQLVARVQNGDKNAFNLLVVKYQQRIFNLILQVVRDVEEAEDLAQDTFIKAYRALAKFRGDCAFYTWLYSIALNNARNCLASRSRRPLVYDSEVDSEEPFESRERLTDIDSPESVALADEIGVAIHEALDALPEELRVALVLRELEGLSYDEIATAMGCPIGTVRSRIFRAREAVDQRLKGLI